MKYHCLLLLCIALVLGIPTLRAEEPPRFSAASRGSLRRAIVDLTETFGDRYPCGKQWLARLDLLDKRLVALEEEGKTKATTECVKELEGLRREALVANPLVSGQPIIYAWRNQYKLGGHHAIDTLFHTGEINTDCFQGPGALKTVDVKTGKVTTLVEASDGIARDPELHFDGRRIGICHAAEH